MLFNKLCLAIDEFGFRNMHRKFGSVVRWTRGYTRKTGVPFMATKIVIITFVNARDYFLVNSPWGRQFDSIPSDML